MWQWISRFAPERTGPASYRPFLVVLAVATALPLWDGVGSSLGWWCAGLAVVLGMAATWRYGEWRELAWPGLVAALLTFPTMLLLELADPRHPTALAPMLIVPIVWCALFHGLRELTLVVVLSGVSLFLPILLIGAPGYPYGTWRRGLLWLVVLGFVAPTIHVLVASLRRISSRLAQSEQRYRLAFTEAPVAILIIGAEGDERGRVLQANRALHALIGRCEQALSTHVADFIDPTDMAALTRELAGVDPGARREAELRVTRADGREVRVLASLALVRNAPDEPSRYICHLEDITVRHEAEHTMLEALERQSHAAEQLREVATARSELVAAVSHDVRTPLATISAYVQLLMASDAGPLNTDQLEMLEIVAHNVRRADGITGDLLARGRLEHAAETVPAEPVRIDDVLQRAVRSTELTATARAQRLTLDSQLAGATVAGDATQLDRVLANLLTNAVKFTPEGGTIAVRGRVLDGEVRIEVRDTGAGIPTAEQSRIFERFYRADTARTRRVAGTGLGLAIAKEIAALHGGTIDVRSAPGRGSTFILRLPAVDAAVIP